MKSIKYFLCGLLVLSLALFCFGCSSEGTETSAPSVSSKVSQVESSAPEPAPTAEPTPTPTPAPTATPTPEPTAAPTPEPTPAQTQYGSGSYYLQAVQDSAVYDIYFTDGVMTEAYYEDMEGKGGWGPGNGSPIEKFRYYGMTIEQVMEKLQAEGFTPVLSEN